MAAKNANEDNARLRQENLDLRREIVTLRICLKAIRSSAELALKIYDDAPEAVREASR